MKKKRYARKVRAANAGIGRERLDITIPPEIARMADVVAGDSMEIRVTPSKRIILLPLRPGWPKECEATTDCRRAEGHEGECIVEEELPW